jgi:hypothetical protein
MLAFRTDSRLKIGDLRASTTMTDEQTLHCKALDCREPETAGVSVIVMVSDIVSGGKDLQLEEVIS